MNLKCLFGHKWNGCKCNQCGKQRDQSHTYILASDSCREKCEICGKEQIRHHWNGCKCKKCGKTRDENHIFELVPGCCIEKCTGCAKQRPQHHWVDVSGYCVKKCAVCGEMQASHETVNGNCSKCGKEFLYKSLYEDPKNYAMILYGLNEGAKSTNPGFDNTIRSLFGKISSIVAIGVVAPYAVLAELNPLVNNLLKAMDGKPIFKNQSADDIIKVGTIIKTLEIVGGVAKDLVNVDDKIKARIEAGLPAEKSQPLSGGSWSLQTSCESRYYSQNAGSLYAASEILKNLDSVPSHTYYMIDTPDGTLGRDINGFFTESPIKTQNLKIDNPCGETCPVQPQSLMGYGDMIKNQTSVAYIKMSGQYAKLVLMMKCGKCGYESPIETEVGNIERECYYCGIKNKTNRAGISVYTENGVVEV